MELQRILFPNVRECKEEELYFRIEKNAADGGRMRRNLSDAVKGTEKKAWIPSIQRGETLVFDTYFNAFSIEKWRKYTTVRDIYLNLKLSGKWKIYLLNKKLDNKTVYEKILSERCVEADSLEEFAFRFETGETKGVYAFKAEALSNECRIYGGAYCSEIPKKDQKSVKIGLCICTYKREKFIEKNLTILNEGLLTDESSPIYGHLEVFIADNGKTLKPGMIQTDNIHIYPNRNLGGAGGFTRGVIEVYNSNGQRGITHILFMDDDVMIEPESIIKTYMLLSLIKKEYENAFIGGAMLSLDERYIQTESGAVWNGGRLKPLKSNLDLRKCENCLYNEQEEDADYNAWWYCCFPIGVVKEDNLPLPVFIRWDDIEYGLRNIKKLILMNGIAVWHEPFENKFSSYLEYYSVRNQLIANALHCPWYSAKNLRKEMLSRCVQEIMFYRYKSVELYLQGIQDYLKGPAWLAAQDGEKLHQKVMEAGYKSQPVSVLEEKAHIRFSAQDYGESCRIPDEGYRKRWRYATFNGLFLPARGENCIPMAKAKTIQFYRKKRVLHYNETDRTGFVTEKSLLFSLKYIFKMVWVMLKVSCNYKKIQKDYIANGRMLMTFAFWKEYLK